MNHCPCGKVGRVFSHLLEQVFCSDRCYDLAYKLYMEQKEKALPTAGDPDVMVSLGM